MIQDPDTITKVTTKLEEALESPINTKAYSLLNESTLPQLTQREYHVSLNTLGQKYLLYLTTIEEDKRYCIFISRKKGQMIVARFQFTDDLFVDGGTLIEGDLIKLAGEQDQWVFLATDLLLDSGESVKTRPLKGRIRRLTDILTNKHIPASETDCYRLIQSRYFECKYIQSMLTDFRPTLEYGSTVTGLYFKALDGRGKDILYILPECRNMAPIVPRNSSSPVTSKPSSPMKSGVVVSTPPIIKKDKPMIPGLLFKSPIEKPIKRFESADRPNRDTVKPKEREKVNKVVPEHACFRLVETELPDVYELFGKDGKLCGHAAIPDMQTSQLVSGLLDSTPDPAKLFVKCSYLPQFERWMPIEQCAAADYIF